MDLNTRVVIPLSITKKIQMIDIFSCDQINELKQSCTTSEPKKIVVAIPVGPPSTINLLKSRVDEVICLQVEENFAAVKIRLAKLKLFAFYSLYFGCPD